MLKFLKYLLIIIVVLCAAAVIGSYILLKNFNPNDYKQKIEQIVSKEINREVKINGDISVVPSLVPTISASKISVANTDWASAPYIFSVENIKIKFALLPLLEKNIVIDEVRIEQPKINLQMSKDGNPNWDFSNLSPEKIQDATQKIETEINKNTAAVTIGGLFLGDAKIVDGEISYIDDKTKQSHKLEINNIAFDYSGNDAPLGVSFSAKYDKYPLSGKIAFASLSAIMKNKPDFPLDVQIQIADSSVVFNGTVSELSPNANVNGKINAYNPASGFGMPETTLVAKIDANTAKINAEISTLNIATNLITGTISADISQKIPQIKANLSSDFINVPSFNQQYPTAYEFSLIKSAAAAEPDFMNTALPYNLLKDFNLNANISIKQLVINSDLSLSSIKSKILLSNGILSISPLNFNIGGGKASAEIVANADKKHLSINLSGNGIVLQQVAKSLNVSDGNSFGIISGGNTDIFAKLQSFGNTPNELIKNLDGQSIGILNESKVQYGKLNLMQSNLLSQVAQALQIYHQAKTKGTLKCAVIRADFKNGEAVFPQGIAIDSKDFTLISDGKINLSNHKINFSMRPSSRKLKDTNLSQAISSLIKVSGTVENPKIALDDAGAVKAVVGFIATGPAMLGSQVLLNGDDAPCHTALKGTSFADKFPVATGVKSTSKKAYTATSDAFDTSINAVTQTTKDVVKGTAKGVINLLKDMSKKQ